MIERATQLVHILVYILTYQHFLNQQVSFIVTHRLLDLLYHPPAVWLMSRRCHGISLSLTMQEHEIEHLPHPGPPNDLLENEAVLRARNLSQVPVMSSGRVSQPLRSSGFLTVFHVSESMPSLLSSLKMQVQPQLVSLANYYYASRCLVRLVGVPSLGRCILFLPESSRIQRRIF